MALLFQEGFDKHGGLNTVSANVAALLTAGEWTSTTGTSLSIVAPLSATGFALSFGSATTASKTLASNYSRLIGGFRFSSTLGGLAGISFNDGGSNQCGISVNTTGNIVFRNGNAFSGAIIATSATSVTANTTHYLEFDITFGNANSYQVWLDGVSVLSGTADLTTTVNNYANGYTIGSANSSLMIFDDLYLLDTTGPAPLNAPLLTSPRIETQFPSSDGAVQFAIGAAILGSTTPRGGTTSNAVNSWRVHAFIPTMNCTLSAVAFSPAISNAAPQFRPIVYSDSAGLPGTLLTTGATVTGMTANVPVVMPLTTPQVLVAGTRYWLGMMTDVTTGGSSLSCLDGSSNDRTAGVTFSSGAPASAPGGQVNSINVCTWGVVSGITSNAYTVSNNPPQGNNSYVYDATIGHEDLYNFPALSVTPSNIYAVAVKANVSKSDAGSRGVSVRCKSGATDSAGTGGTQAPGTSFAWISSHFATDPNGGGAWSKAALDAAQAGLRVES